jgi:hypothetical protein
MKVLIVIFAVLLVLFIGGYVVLSSLNAPSSDSLPQKDRVKLLSNMQDHPQMVNAKNTSQGSIKYVGKNMSFLYPSSSIIYHGNDANIKQSKIILESLEFDERMPTVNFIVQAIQRDQSMTIDSLPEILFRNSHNYEYQEKDVTIDGNPCKEYIKLQDQVEYDAFCLVNSREFSLVASGSDNSFISNIFQNVISSFHIMP